MSEVGPDDLPMALWPEIEIIEGAAEALSFLRGKLPLAIATNAAVSDRSMIDLAVSRAGFGATFDHIFCTTDLGFRKGQREFWSAVEQGIGVPLANIAMIGDSYEQDAFFPRTFGVQAVWFNLRGSVHRGQVAVPVATSLPEFAQWVASAA